MISKLVAREKRSKGLMQHCGVSCQKDPPRQT